MTMHGSYGQTVEGPLMCASALMDFACCSYGGVIRVFHYAPKAWDEATFWHFRAEGAFVVSARRANGVTRFIGIISEAGGVCRVLSDIGSDVQVSCDRMTVPFSIDGGKTVFETEAGNEYIITGSAAIHTDLSVCPVMGKPHERNFFGLKAKSRY
jgi:hypothetical protein